MVVVVPDQAKLDAAGVAQWNAGTPVIVFDASAVPIAYWFDLQTASSLYTRELVANLRGVCAEARRDMARIHPAARGSGEGLPEAGAG